MTFGNTIEVYTVWPANRQLLGAGRRRTGVAGSGQQATGLGVRVSASERPGGDTDQLRLHGVDPIKRSGGLHLGVAPLGTCPPEPKQQSMSRSANGGETSSPGTAEPNTVTEAAGAGRSPCRSRVTGPVQVLKRLLGVWNLEAAEATILLGLDRDAVSYAEDFLAGRTALKGRDVSDRIVHLYEMRKTLSALFRDENVENQWLREQHAMLDERAPLDLMLEGSMENMLLVREYVEAAAGR